MRHLISSAVLIGASTVVSVAAELPTPVIDGLVVEEAWAVPRQGGADIYLVINNRNVTGVGPIGIEVEGAASTRIVRSTGEALEPTLPPHAELYMQPEGVRIEVSGVSITTSVPVTISVGTDRVTVEAQVLQPGEKLPDHHDYVHV